MKCKHCGKEIEDDSVFCNYCGKEQPKVKLCIKCGKEIDVNDEWCKYCGSKQEAAAERSQEQELRDSAPKLCNDKKGTQKRKYLTVGIIAVALVLLCLGGMILYRNYKAVEPLPEQVNSDSIHAADSISSAERKLEQRTKDSLDWVNFTTPDLFCFGVHGHVKCIKEKEGLAEKSIYTFDENGKLLSYVYEGEKMNINRDSKGRIKEAAEADNDVIPITLTYKYNSSGTLISIVYEVNRTFGTYKIDANGRFKTYEESYDDASGFDISDNSYAYVKCDEYGNWTECKVTGKSQFLSREEFDEEIESGEIDAPYVKEEPYYIKRTITYYPR